MHFKKNTKMPHAFPKKILKCLTHFKNTRIHHTFSTGNKILKCITYFQLASIVLLSQHSSPVISFQNSLKLSSVYQKLLYLCYLQVFCIFPLFLYFKQTLILFSWSTCLMVITPLIPL